MTRINDIRLAAIAALALSCAIRTAAADVVAVVSSKSTVTVLSKTQVADLFLGKISRFPDGAPASPVDQSEGSPLREAFYQKVAGKSAAQLKSYWSKIIFTGRGQPPPAVAGDADVKARIAQNPAVIGYIDSKLIDSSVRVVLPQ